MVKVRNSEQCPAFATHVDEVNGRERTVICNDEPHDDPSDGTAEHYDETLDIYWHYADGLGYDDSESDPALTELGEL